MLRRILQTCFLLAFLLINWSLHARVTRVEISSRHDVLGGKTFGEAGAYERILGRVYFSIPVANPHNQRIVDLANAENLKNGEVEFAADFVAVRPKYVHKGNGSMLLEVPNRGHSRILSLVDGGDEDLAKDAGDAWFLSNGFTVVSLGWQWDADGADAQKLYAPIAKENGKTITGLLRGDLMLPKVMAEIPLGHYFFGRIGGVEYPVSAQNDARNTLTVRDTREGQRTTIPRSQWDFARMVDGKLVPSNRHIHLKGGFQSGKIYEYVYVVADPVVAGCGFAAIRDFAAYAKHASDAVIPAARVYGEGISQNGRFLRDFLYQGFNADEDGRMALDGVLAHVAGAGRGSFNYRFAQPSRDAQPTSSIFFPTDIFPFTDQPETDAGHWRAGRIAGSRGERQSRAEDFLFQYFVRILGTRGGADSCDRRRQAGRRRVGECPHLSLHGPATLFGAVSSGKGRRRHDGSVAPVAIADQVFLAVDDREYGCVGPQWDAAAGEQLSEDRRMERWCHSASWRFPRFRE